MVMPTFFKSQTLKGLLIHLLAVVTVGSVIAICYFQVYLKSVTNHGTYIEVPNLVGMPEEGLSEFLKENLLRYDISDSSYAKDLPPNTVVQHFPHAGTHVKENRIIHITLNRNSVPTVPTPNLVDQSLINAKLVLSSNELVLGDVSYRRSPYKNLVLSMKNADGSIEPGTRIPKGSVINLVIGSGGSKPDFGLGMLIGDTYERALFKLHGWNLLLGTVTIPEGVDTTAHNLYVFKQYPVIGDSVKIGSPVDLWLAPKGYEEAYDSL